MIQTYNSWILASTYGEGAYNTSDYNGTTSTGGTGSTGSGGGSLSNTGIAIAGIVTIAAVILLVATVIRIWKRPSKKATATDLKNK